MKNLKGERKMKGLRTEEILENVNKMIDDGRFSDEDQALMDKLAVERNEYLRKAIPYLTAAVKYIDGLDDFTKSWYRANLYNCLKALKSCYVNLDMINEVQPIEQRIRQIESQY